MSTQRQNVRIEALKLSVASRRFDDTRIYPLEPSEVIKAAKQFEDYIVRGEEPTDVE